MAAATFGLAAAAGDFPGVGDLALTGEATLPGGDFAATGDFIRPAGEFTRPGITALVPGVAVPLATVLACFGFDGPALGVAGRDFGVAGRGDVTLAFILETGSLSSESVVFLFIAF